MSKILVARMGDLGFIKVVGRGSFQNAGCLRAFYQQVLKEGTSRFVVDLGSCTYLDSTFLGILLGMGLKLRQAAKGILHILNASPRNMELLKNLGLDRLISIESAPEPGLAPSNGTHHSSLGNGAASGANGIAEKHFEEIACPAVTKAQAGPTILEAHEALMEFDARNVPKFKDVVEFLREDLGQPASR